MPSYFDDLAGPLQRFEVYSQQQPHDVTYSIPLSDGRIFQVTCAIVEKRPERRPWDTWVVRRPAIHELQEGIMRFSSLPIREAAAGS